MADSSEKPGYFLSKKDDYFVLINHIKSYLKKMIANVFKIVPNPEIKTVYLFLV